MSGHLYGSADNDRAMSAIDYPPHRLDIKFVVEAKSPETVAAVEQVGCGRGDVGADGTRRGPGGGRRRRGVDGPLSSGESRRHCPPALR